MTRGAVALARRKVASTQKMLESAPRSLSPDVLQQCVAIIKPAAGSRERCTESIAIGFNMLVGIHADPELFGAAFQADTRRKTRELARALKKAMIAMYKQPWAWVFSELGAVPGADEQAEQEWERVVLYLAYAWADAERELAVLKTRPADMLKRFCALVAYDVLGECGARRPTLTIDGPFFQLAAVLYEAVTGASEANLERACRSVFRTGADDSRPRS
jgi:hypothetical protein